MSQDEPRRIGLSIELKPHAYDPVSSPELFEGVLARRVIAFFIDLAIITVPVVVAAMFIFLFGLFTLGLGWFLFWLLSPGAVIWALLYYGLTFGSPGPARRPVERPSASLARHRARHGGHQQPVAGDGAAGLAAGCRGAIFASPLTAASGLAMFRAGPAEKPAGHRSDSRRTDSIP